MSETSRKVEILKGDEWVESSMRYIREGDTFRMFEPNGMPVGTADMVTEFVASCDAYVVGTENKVWGVNIRETKDGQG